jgi:hypothetical protein
LGGFVKRQIGQVDLETGEIMRGVVVWIRVKYSPFGRWFMANQEALFSLAKDKEITGECYRVLMVLLGQLDFENYIHVPQRGIADMLDIRPQHVHRAIKLLEQKGILLRSATDKRLYGYRLNPYYGWKGKSNKLQNARLELVKG